MVQLMTLVDAPASSNSSVVNSNATKRDIDDLGEKLVWPPEFTRDIRLRKMQKLLDMEDDVRNNPKLSDTEKVLRVAEFKRQYNIHDNERYEPALQKVGAVPPMPLHVKANKTEDSDTDDASDTDSDTDTMLQMSGEDEDSVSAQTDENIQELLKPIQAHRKQKAKLMLKKLASEGTIKWDTEGNVFYKGQHMPGANMSQLVTYFQTAHKKYPIPPPEGYVAFGRALRKAHATEDVQLGGVEDDEVRNVFKGHTPATPRFRKASLAGRISKPKSHKKKSPIFSQTNIKSMQARGEKLVSQLEL